MPVIVPSTGPTFSTRPFSPSFRASTFAFVGSSTQSRRMRLCRLLPNPSTDERAVPLHLLLVLVRWEDRADDVDEQRVECLSAEVLDRQRPDRRQRRSAELVVRVDLEVLVGEPPVLA